MNPKVSILIPLYNSEKYITETIESCLNQTYKNTETIIIDDQSNDSSYNIALKYQKQYQDKIYVFKNTRKGSCAARNYAFEKSTGKYIQYLDADDLLKPDKIENQIKLFNQHGDDIVISGMWGRFFKSPGDVKWENQSINKDYENTINWLVDSWEGKGMTTINAWLTPRYIIEKSGKWNEKLLINQDGEFFSRVIVNAKKIIFSPEAKVYYRSGLPDSISRSLSKEKAASLLYSFSLYVTNLNTHLEKPEVKHALMMNFLNFIYQYYDIYPELVQSAKTEIQNLGFKKLEITGGKTFRKAALLLGFENTLKIRKAISKYTKIFHDT